MADATTTGWFQIVTPIATFLIGYGAKSFSEWVQHQRTVAREREAREAARKDQRDERRIIFQRQTLLDLQEVMFKLVRAAAAMHHQDVMAHRQTGKWQKQLFGEELSEGFRLSMAQSRMLLVRVRDSATRDVAEQVRGHATDVTISTTQQEAEQAMMDLAPAFDALNGRIGEVLRQLDEAED